MSTVKCERGNFTAQQWRQGLRVDAEATPCAHEPGRRPGRYSGTAAERTPSALPEAARMFKLAPGRLKRHSRNTTTPSGRSPRRAGPATSMSRPGSARRLCTAVVGKYDVYFDQDHLTADYALLLERVLAASPSTSSGSVSGPHARRQFGPF